VQSVTANLASAQPEARKSVCAVQDVCVREDAFHAILEVDPSGVALLATSTLAVAFANGAFRAATPDPAADPVGRSVEEIWPTEAGLELRAALERVCATGEPVRFERLDVAAADGGARRFAYHAQLLRERDDPTLLLVLWETTEVEAARSQAERSRERAELIAALAAELNAGAGLDAVLATAVTRAAALVGAEDGSIWLLASDDSREVQGVAELAAHGRLGVRRPLRDHPAAAAALAEGTARIIRWDTAERSDAGWMAAHGVVASLVVPLMEGRRPTGLLYLDYGESGFLPSPHDIAFAEAIAEQCALAVGRARVFEAERAARARAEAAEREARRAEQIQANLAAMLGHDLRTPLQAVALGAEVLARRHGLSEADQKTVARIAASTSKMQRMVVDLLDFARLRAGERLPVDFAPMDLGEVARAAAQELEIARSRAVELDVAGDLAMEGDAVRLSQLVSNLLGHALRAAPPGASVRGRLDGKGGVVTLIVDAEGVVVDPRTVAQLFEPFATASGGDPLHGSFGLGLFIAREIARAHGGDAEVIPGLASTRFTAWMPRGRPAALASGPARLDAEAPGARAG
jgi:signal transduction histidine kinase